MGYKLIWCFVIVLFVARSVDRVEGTFNRTIVIRAANGACLGASKLSTPGSPVVFQTNCNHSSSYWMSAPNPYLVHAHTRLCIAFSPVGLSDAGNLPLILTSDCTGTAIPFELLENGLLQNMLNNQLCMQQANMKVTGFTVGRAVMGTGCYPVTPDVQFSTKTMEFEPNNSPIMEPPSPAPSSNPSPSPEPSPVPSPVSSPEPSPVPSPEPSPVPSPEPSPVPSPGPIVLCTACMTFTNFFTNLTTNVPPTLETCNELADSINNNALLQQLVDPATLNFTCTGAPVVVDSKFTTTFSACSNSADSTIVNAFIESVYYNFPIYPTILSSLLAFDCDVRLNVTSSCGNNYFFDNACRQKLSPPSPPQAN